MRGNWAVYGCHWWQLWVASVFAILNRSKSFWPHRKEHWRAKTLASRTRCCVLAVVVVVLRSGTFAFAAEPSREAIEFFEKRVRPILVENCHKCHGEKQQKGGLRLDSIAAVLKGGDTGPAVVPGDPKKSLLVDAINYDPNGYQMPPTGKLPDDAIATLTEWVKLGAPWPAETVASKGDDKKFDLAERAKHWSFQPLRIVAPPEIQDEAWARNPIDRFIRTRLEAHGVQPVGFADQRAFLRRVTFELTGLPPSPEEIDAFLADNAPDATDRVIERLLASPRYGERWARHWLDLVRFAETGGHEFDYDIRHSTPYRDYVIRALNADVPYDHFVREHIAGDLLPNPRRDPATHTNESVIGTAFWWFSQGKHSPVDLRAEECDTVDNQLDVLGKTFQGLTIACARCHDHKFDPITQKDYYALAGYLQSSRRTYADTSPPEATTAVLEELDELTRRSQAALWQQSLRACTKFVQHLPEMMVGGLPSSNPDWRPVPLEFIAKWRKTLEAEALNDRGHPFHLWVHWSKSPENAVERIRQWQREWSREPRGQSREPEKAGGADSSVALDSRLWTLDQWFTEGPAFDRSQKLTPLWHGDAVQPLSGLVSSHTFAHSGTVSGRLRGTLRSPTFTITANYIDYLAHRRGGERSSRPLKDGQIHLIIDGFQYIKNPLYGGLSQQIAVRETPQWHRQDVSKWVGSRAYIEIEDSDDGEIIVEQILMHDGARPPETPFHPLIARRLAKAKIDSLTDVLPVYAQVFADALNALHNEQIYGARPFPPEDAAAAASLVSWLCRQTLWPDSGVEASKAANEFVRHRAALEAQIPTPHYTIAITDGSAENEHLLIRGNPRKPGEEVPRRFLEVFSDSFSRDPEGSALPPPTSTRNTPLRVAAKHEPSRGSGRIELADAVTDPANPLTARVLVNRLWQHHFGRGLVPTPDDFGQMGQPPSHPELLDWLAGELIRSGWSLKHIQRLIVTSQTYRLSSQATDSRAEEADPENRLFHRMNVQRLEAEAIRDALLALSGRLDDRMYGPSVLPHLTPFMEGRGRPGQSGPLDGDGRRSIYINVRRNFLSPLFLAFDFPTPFTTMGKRTTSNVPAQALALMNNPFVVEQAGQWSRRVTEATNDPAARVTQLYTMAFSRPPTPEEAASALAFVAEQSNDPRAWQDLAHVLLNVKEFVFVE